MAKLRVYQLARELNRDNAEIIRELQHMGVPVTSHSNTVEDRLADRLRRELGVFTPEAGKAAVSYRDDDIIAVDSVDSVDSDDDVDTVDTDDSADTIDTIHTDSKP